MNSAPKTLINLPHQGRSTGRARTTIRTASAKSEMCRCWPLIAGSSSRAWPPLRVSEPQLRQICTMTWKARGSRFDLAWLRSSPPLLANFQLDDPLQQLFRCGIAQPCRFQFCFSFVWSQAITSRGVVIFFGNREFGAD